MLVFDLWLSWQYFSHEKIWATTGQIGDACREGFLVVFVAPADLYAGQPDQHHKAQIFGSSFAEVTGRTLVVIE
jgi:hypothetical protein